MQGVYSRLKKVQKYKIGLDKKSLCGKLKLEDIGNKKKP